MACLADLEGFPELAEKSAEPAADAVKAKAKVPLAPARVKGTRRTYVRKDGSVYLYKVKPRVWECPEEGCGFKTKETIHWAADFWMAPLQIRHKIGRVAVGRFERQVVVQLPKELPVHLEGGKQVRPLPPHQAAARPASRQASQRASEGASQPASQQPLGSRSRRGVRAMNRKRGWDLGKP